MESVSSNSIKMLKDLVFHYHIHPINTQGHITHFECHILKFCFLFKKMILISLKGMQLSSPKLRDSSPRMTQGGQRVRVDLNLRKARDLRWEISENKNINMQVYNVRKLQIFMNNSD